MIEMKYKTRGNSDPHGKPNVLFTCHPSEHEKYFEMISDMFLKEQDCVVLYIDPEEDISSFDEDDFEFQMKDIQLVVIPVTTQLLTNDSFAMLIVFEAAIKNHIPALPLMMESGLDDVYSRKFGDLQYLEPDSIVNDPTKLPFEERFKKYISSVLVGDDLAKRVRDAFAAYIFMSYRKKDRKYAHELMKMIHSNERLRDVAIWYDEYLVPGESFNDAIKAALEKSELFALVVTPSLLEDGNYIKMHEYPAAKSFGKEIIPVVMNETDIELLREMYEDMPECVKKEGLKSREEYIIEKLKGIAMAPTGDNPEHDFLIGLAYLDGIDVENDNEKAVKLITDAAEAGLMEAIRKLKDMYHNGQGVKRDYEKALEWHEKLVDQCWENWEKEKNEETESVLLTELLEVGDAYEKLDILPLAESNYNVALILSSKSIEEGRGVIPYFMSVSFDRLGDIKLKDGKFEGARFFYEQSLRINMELFYELGTPGCRHNLSVNYHKLGDVQMAEEDFDGARDNYEESLRIAQELSEEPGTPESRLGLLLNYRKLGDVQMAEEDFDGARDNYEESLRIAEELSKESGTPESLSNLSIAYTKIGDVQEAKGDLDGALKSYKKSLRIFKELSDETKTIVSRSNLSKCYNRVGDILKIKGDLDEAGTSYEESLKIAKELSEEPGTPESHRDLATCYKGIGDFQKEIGHFEEAMSSYKKCMNIFKELSKTGTPESRYDLSIAYARIGDIQVEKGDLDGAKVSYEKSLKILNELPDEIKTIRIRRQLLYCYTKIGSIQETKEDLDGARDSYRESLRISKELSEVTGTPNSRHDLSIAYVDVGDIQLEKKDLEGARDSYEKGLRILEELSENTEMINKKDILKNLLAYTYYKLGTLDNDNHQNEYIMTAYKMITELVNEHPGNEEFISSKKEIEQYLSE